MVLVVNRCLFILLITLIYQIQAWYAVVIIEKYNIIFEYNLNIKL